MSNELTPLDFRVIDRGRRARLLAPFRFQSETVGVVQVDEGFITDFNSVPRGLWNILPPWEFPEAGVVHDKLFRDGRVRGVGSRAVTRDEADDVHSEVLRFYGAGRWRVRFMRIGLKLGSWKTWNEHRERDL